MDCLVPEERIEEENFEVYSNESPTNKKKAVVKEEVLPLSVISASIGEITAKDIMIAASSNGKKTPCMT
jgi:translation initiation factor IF-2